eukprot:Hpha_TRINITY_DN16131_c6_g1::TRINITY_DN16131_c6_g1_i1::g.4604::m.4604
MPAGAGAGLQGKYNPVHSVQRGASRQPFLPGGRGDDGLAELDAVTKAVYDDLGRAGGARVHQQQQQQRSASAVDPADTGELLSVMCGRLRTLEGAVGQLRQEVATKERELLTAKREIREQRESSGQHAEQAEELQVLRTQNSAMALQIVEMTNFLREQGLEWVGSGRMSPLCGQGKSPASSRPPSTGKLDDISSRPPPKCGRRSTSQTSTPRNEAKGSAISLLSGLGGGNWDAAATVPQGALETAAGSQAGQVVEKKTATAPYTCAEQDVDKRAAPATGPYFSVEKLKQRVCELNLLVGEKRIVAEGRRLGDGAAVRRFVDPEEIPIVLFLDGIVVNRGPFRPYWWTLARAFIDDILDGYFPYEYKDRFPDGMLMNVTDRCGETHLAGRTAGNVRSAGDEEGYRELSREEFLSRLPQQVVTARGRMVDVRRDVADFMSGKADSATQAEPSATETPDEAEADADGELVVVQVRIVGGGMLQAKLKPSQTVGDLRGRVAARLPADQRGKPFELLTAFPRKTYTDDKQTLAEAGMGQRAALLMRVL